MADPISTASGLLALVAFALQSSQLLYQTVVSFQNNQRVVRELREELEALDEVLQALQETASNSEADLESLKLPLLRCGKGCKDFQTVIDKCTAHSGGSRTSFRDWAKLRYMGDDIVAFRNMLAGYKSTINIALGDANLRTSAITLKVLKEYKDMITITTIDLQEHLEDFDNKLRALSLHSSTISEENVRERQQIQEERDSTQQCLGICAQVFSHIDAIEPTIFENISTASGAYQGPVAKLAGLPSARIVTADVFKACKERLSDTSSQLERHLQDINNRLQTIHSPLSKKSNEIAAERERIQEEVDSIKQCLAICDEASTQANKERTNVFEDVSTADDGLQALVSTIGDLISARRVTAGARSMQLLGQMSDDSLQQLSRHRGPFVGENDTRPPVGTGAEFKGRYGAGVKLSSPNLKDVGARAT